MKDWIFVIVIGIIGGIYYGLLLVAISWNLVIDLV
jgi:hypothetical protein